LHQLNARVPPVSEEEKEPAVSELGWLADRHGFPRGSGVVRVEGIPPGTEARIFKLAIE
jgi:hypothetical protein